MRRVALIYNPASGQHSGRRASYVQSALGVLRKAGIEAEALETHAPASGKSLALAAVRRIVPHKRKRRTARRAGLATVAIRIRSFGGALGALAPGATLHKKDLSLVAFKTRSRLEYLRFLLAALAGRQTFSRTIELLD